MMAKDEAKSTKIKTGKIKAKLLNTYYGNPSKDMKLICITGATGKIEVANFVHEILKAAGQPVAILASEEEIRVGALHKFLSTAWKAGSNYCVITAPVKSLEDDAFYGLPVYAAAITNSTSSHGESILFKMHPNFVILNHDDASFDDFNNFAGTDATISYGSDRSSNIEIVRSKGYKHGTDADLSIGSTNFNVASFLTGESVPSYMAAATAIADALHITPEKIAEGIANYDPDHLSA
ncbi:hypothetical protein IKW75_03060 [Candidatus Saccharibacteria bacterium]|nr:hypothetical protein [Candidatus Saccharibacteria bacterium]